MKRKILLADDEDNLRLLVRSTLEQGDREMEQGDREMEQGDREMAQDDWEILEAPDGRQALEAALHWRPDLVLLDWMMPQMTGIEVARAIRADPVLAKVPIILLTARMPDHDRMMAGPPDIDVVLAKPFRPAELLATVRQLVACKTDE